jgi:cell division control protein 45
MSMCSVLQEYGLENVKYTGFVRVTGYKSRLSASDMSYAVTALLECSAAAMVGGASNSSNVDDTNGDPLAGLNEEDREDREMIEAFNVAFDALNSNGGGPVSSSSESMLTEVGGGEGADLSNLVNGGNMTGTTGLGAGIRLAMTLQRTIMSTARGLVDRNAITRLSHFRYAYLHCTSGGGGGATLSNSSSNGRVVTPDASGNKYGETSTTNNRSNQFHVFAKPLVLTRLAHFLMDMHREDGKWTGTKSRPLVLLAEKPRSNTYMVVGYECPEEAGNVVKNKFGQNFDLAAKSMRGMFWFDSFDSNVVEVAARDVQKFLEQLHYMMEQV